MAGSGTKPWKRPVLRDVLMPAQLVWLSAELDQPDVTPQDRLDVHSRLFELVATCEFIEPFYLADVASVMLSAAARPDSNNDPFSLPGFSFGSSPEFEAVSALYEALSTSTVSVRPTGVDEGSESFDVLSFVVYAARAFQVHARFRFDEAAPRVLEFGNGVPHEQEAETTLLRIVTAFSAQCQFKLTGDSYLHAILQLRLPSWPFSGMVKGMSPFKLASRLLAEGCNDAVRPLIDAGVDPFLKRLTAPGALAADQAAAETFAVVACLVDEMCGKRNLMVNDAVALAPPDAGEPRPFVNGDFGCLPPHCFGVVDGPSIWIAQRPLQAVAAVLSRSPPSTLQARLWEVVSAPAGADLPGNPFAKYMA